MRAENGSVTRFLRREAIAGGLKAAMGLLAGLALSACAAGPVTAPPAGGGAAASAAGARNVDVSKPVPVALLLPSSGPESSQQAQARDMEAAARLAVDANPGLIELRVHDTGADPARARAEAEKAVAAGAALILGPVYAQEATAVAAVAAASGVPALSFTPFSGAAGGGVYAMGFAPENEVARILSYAVSQGRSSVAVVRPAEQYGEVVEAAVRDPRRSGGARLAASIAYQRTNAGVQGAAESGADQIRASGADSVLLVDRGQGLLLVAAYLNYFDVTPSQYQFLGLSGWKTDATLQEAALRGGLFAAADRSLTDAFAARFQAATGRTPSDLAVLAHDGAAAAAELVRAARASGADTPFARGAITRPEGFEGAAGAFRFGADGLVDRSLAIYEVTPEGFALRAPAATRFAAGS